MMVYVGDLNADGVSEMVVTYKLTSGGFDAQIY